MFTSQVLIGVPTDCVTDLERNENGEIQNWIDISILPGMKGCGFWRAKKYIQDSRSDRKKGVIVEKELPIETKDGEQVTVWDFTDCLRAHQQFGAILQEQKNLDQAAVARLRTGEMAFGSYKNGAFYLDFLKKLPSGSFEILVDQMNREQALEATELFKERRNLITQKKAVLKSRITPSRHLNEDWMSYLNNQFKDIQDAACAEIEESIKQVDEKILNIKAN